MKKKWTKRDTRYLKRGDKIKFDYYSKRSFEVLSVFDEGLAIQQEGSQKCRPWIEQHSEAYICSKPLLIGLDVGTLFKIDGIVYVRCEDHEEFDNEVWVGRFQDRSGRRECIDGMIEVTPVQLVEEW